MAVLLVCSALVLTACRKHELAPPQTTPIPAAAVAPAATPPQEVVDRTAAVVTESLEQAADAVADALPIPAVTVEKPPPDLITQDAFNLIVRWEVGSPTQYTRKYEGVICPGGASGPTWGVGYDGGHQQPTVIVQDWVVHPQVGRLIASAGEVGEARCTRYRGTVMDVRTAWALALTVFRSTSVLEYHKRTIRAFPGAESLPPNAQGALVSLVYNRGTAMAGDRRREMRVIRDKCVPKGDVECIAAQLRMMTRIWEGSTIAAGMRSRRYDEARLAVKP